MPNPSSRSLFVFGLMLVGTVCFAADSKKDIAVSKEEKKEIYIPNDLDAASRESSRSRD